MKPLGPRSISFLHQQRDLVPAPPWCNTRGKTQIGQMVTISSPRRSRACVLMSSHHNETFRQRFTGPYLLSQRSFDTPSGAWDNIRYLKWAVSSAAERIPHTDEAAGSKPAPPTTSNSKSSRSAKTIEQTSKDVPSLLARFLLASQVEDSKAPRGTVQRHKPAAGPGGASKSFSLTLAAFDRCRIGRTSE